MCFSHHEKFKKRAHEQRIIKVEHGSFTPLVFSTTGGMGRQSTIFYSHLATPLGKMSAIQHNNGLALMPLVILIAAFIHPVYSRLQM
jgi:hypothetical protein